MRYSIFYWCVSHIGKVRKENQDNLICDNRYLDTKEENTEFRLSGKREPKPYAIFGVFDGLGGESCGEIASHIAAKSASALQLQHDAPASLRRFCRQANTEICTYAEKNNVVSMGTTAAMLAFTKDRVTLCNIGDSKVFHYHGGELEQISKDHVIVSDSGAKPPLFQNLGIPPSELIIDPYVAQGFCHDGDVYLICSDGLTDMVTTQEIAEILRSGEISEAAGALLDKALARGGKDNITLIVCKIQRKLRWFSGRNERNRG